MLVRGQQLFNISEVNTFIAKFEEKLEESSNKINQLNSDISKLEAEIDACMTEDILKGTASSKKDLSNVQARKSNVESQLADEMKKVYKIKEIMDKGLADIIPQASKQIDKDFVTYNAVVEREIFSQLQEIREQQELLLLTLQLARTTAIGEMSKFDQACQLAGLTRYEKVATLQAFHVAGFLPNRAFPELGSPLLNCQNLLAVEDNLMRSQAEANAMYNSLKEVEDRVQLPQSKRVSDVDLEAFLAGIKK